MFAGVDVTRAPIPVLPTVHYNMGGIPTNYHGEVLRPTAADPEATVRGLMAVGEAACVSVHGANRLGTNSLLDLVVFGGAAALRATATIQPGASQAPLPADAPARRAWTASTGRGMRMAAARSRISASNCSARMQKHAAVFRSSASLTEGVGKMKALWGGVSDMAVTDRSLIWNSDLVEALELQNLVPNGSATMAGAEARQESRGAQAHDDFPDRDDANWMKPHAGMGR